MNALQKYIKSQSKDFQEVVEAIFEFKKEVKPIHRKLFFEDNFLLWMVYYFTLEFKVPLAQFHIDYANALQNGKNVFFIGFRESAKSMFLTYYYVWCILYKKRNFILHYNSKQEQANSMLRDVIYVLENNERLIYDYGRLYKTPEKKKKQETKDPKKVSEFITENGVKLKAMTMGKSPRGEKIILNGETYRPDLIGFDDIDNILNTKNPEIIKKDVDFILNEVLGGVASYSQIVILGNVVREKGRSIELKKHFEKDNSFQVFWIPVYNLDTKEIVWKERFVHTDKEAQQINKNIQDPKAQVVSLETRKKQQGLSAFNANYLLIPMKDSGESIITKEYIHYFQKVPANAIYVMGIDPAFSEKTNSDPVGITITAQWKFENNIYKYVVYSTKLEKSAKQYQNFVNFVKNLYVRYKVKMVYIEQNNGGGIIADMLKNNHLAVKKLNSTKDKITRLREYEGEIQTGIVKFITDEKKVGDLIEQLLEFPNVEHDDMVDSFVFSLTPFSNSSIRAI